MFFIKPAPGMVIIKPDINTEELAPGIPFKGTIMAVGDSFLNKDGSVYPQPCKEGERVIYQKWQVNEVLLEGEKYVFGKFEHLLGILLNEKSNQNS